MKKLVILLVVALALMVMGGTAVAAKKVVVFLNGSELDAQVKIIDGKAYLPIKDVARAFEAEMFYNDGKVAINSEALLHWKESKQLAVKQKERQSMSDEFQKRYQSIKGESLEAYEQRLRVWEEFGKPIDPNMQKEPVWIKSIRDTIDFLKKNGYTDMKDWRNRGTP